MILNKHISLVLPCRNEANALPVLIKAVPKCVDEIIVINNRSTDNTEKVAKKLGVRIINERRIKNGIGYGFALAHGIKSARGDIIICMDGDGSYPVSYIPKVVSSLLSGKNDFISCNRLPFKDPRKMSGIRTLGVNILNIMVWALYNYKIKDSLTGMWVFRREVIDELNLYEGDWNFSLEIKLNAIANQKIKFMEYKIPYHDRIFDLSKQNLFKTGFDHAMFLLKKKFFPNRNILGKKYKVLPLI